MILKTLPKIKIFTITGIIVIFGFLSQSCNSACPRQEVDCQVYLNKDQTSPYRDLKAPHTGWHFAGYVDVPGCWSKKHDQCVVCNDSESLRETACGIKFKGYTSRAGSGTKILE